VKTALTCAISFVISTVLFGATYTVPDDYVTIQGAINVSDDGDTILVRPGTYVENIDLQGKLIIVQSLWGPEVTTIDGNRAGNVVTANSGEKTQTVLSGFTIMNGLGANGSGGIICSNSSPKIENNVITYNQGYGIAGFECRSQVIGNTFILNSSSAVFCTDGSKLNIQDNLFFANTADFGAGILCEDSSTSKITNNFFAGNSAVSGAAIFINTDSTPRIMNNTMSGNYASASGGAIVCRSSAPLVRNCVFWGNDAPQGKEIYVGGTFAAPSVLTIDYSDVEGGQSQVFVESGHTLDWGAGMIDQDPLFFAPSYADYHLSFHSPCRDAGTADQQLPSEDFEDDPRTVNGTIDMGADEFNVHLYFFGTASPGGTIYMHVVGIPGSKVTGIMGSAIKDPPQGTNYGWVHMEPPYYFFPLGFMPGDGILPKAVSIPPHWMGDYYFQALTGTTLTNLLVVRVFP